MTIAEVLLLPLRLVSRVLLVVMSLLLRVPSDWGLDLRVLLNLGQVLVGSMLLRKSVMDRLIIVKYLPCYRLLLNNFLSYLGLSTKLDANDYL